MSNIKWFKMIKTAKKSSLIGICISLSFMLAFNGFYLNLYIVLGYLFFGAIVGFAISLTNDLVSTILFSNKNNQISLKIIVTYFTSFIVFYLVGLPFAYLANIPNSILFYLALAAALPSVIISLFFVTIKEKEARIQLEKKKKELAIIEERNRIARELHDSVSQNLFGINLNLNTLNYLLNDNPNQTETMIKELQDMVQEVQTEMRLMIYELKPLELTENNFLEAIENLIILFKRRYELNITFSTIEEEKSVNSEVQLVLYRILQESLNNILKHAQATKIEVYLELKSDKIKLSIIDNGIGFEMNNIDTNNSFGLKGMKERIESIKGELIINSTKGQGTSVSTII